MDLRHQIRAGRAPVSWESGCSGHIREGSGGRRIDGFLGQADTQHTVGDQGEHDFACVVCECSAVEPGETEHSWRTDRVRQDVGQNTFGDVVPVGVCVGGCAAGSDDCGLQIGTLLRTRTLTQGE